MTDQARGVVWADATGRTRLTILKSVGSSGTIESALQAKSNAEVLYDFAGTIGASIGTPATAVFQAVGQAAVLTFQTGSGSILKVTLPAPQAGIMLPDGVTVDPTKIAAIIAACVGTLSDGAGNTAVAFVAGFVANSPADISPLG